jgi:DNA polymerase-3 subunit delta
VWPITIEQLAPWIMQRAKKIGLSILPDAAKLLAEQVEGNLLAAGQEIEKLGLLQTTGVIDVNTIEQAVTDNARFDIFNLVECALSGNGQRSIRILENLQAEGVEPVLVLWALARELRTMADLSRQVQQGANLSTLFGKYRIWEKRQNGVRQFLRQHNARSCWDLLSRSAKIDRIIKGGERGNVWLELSQLALNMSGNVIIKA